MEEEQVQFKDLIQDEKIPIENVIDENITISLQHVWDKFYLFLDEINPYRDKKYDLEYPKFRELLEEYYLLYPTFEEDSKIYRLAQIDINPECSYYFYMFTIQTRISI